MHVEAAGKTGERTRERERDQALAVDGHSDRSGGCCILARRAQHPAVPAALVEEGDHDRDQGADRRLAEAGGLRHGRERVQARPDPLPVAEHVVRDLEDAERGDSRRETRQAHQRQADDQRVCRADPGRDRERGRVADGRVAKEAGEVGHDRRLLRYRHREDARRPRADRDEADVPEREHARVADEHVEGGDDRNVDEGRDVDTAVPKSATAPTRSTGASTSTSPRACLIRARPPAGRRGRTTPVAGSGARR